MDRQPLLPQRNTSIPFIQRRPLLKSFILFIAYVLVLYTVRHWTTRVVPVSMSRDPAQFQSEIALKHLRNITQLPHTAASKENRRVAEYILSTVTELQAVAESRGKKIEIEVPGPNEKGKVVNAHEMYFMEGGNILVRLHGAKSSRDALLISAHYDSVSFGYGAADNGVGVAISLEILRALVHSGNLNFDLVVNFNNAEELGLLGARDFMQSPWASGIRAVLNIDGLGPSNDALLFRITDVELARLYGKYAPFPNANSLLNDVFKYGLVSSNTDYSVYSTKLRGWDLAFPLERSKYHTPHDNFNNFPIEGVSKTGINMLSVTKGILQNDLLSLTALQPEFIVYYDVLGRFILAFSKVEFALCQLALLLFSTIVLIWAFIKRNNRLMHSDHRIFMPFGYLLLALMFSVASGLLLSAFIWLVNPTIVYRSPWLVLLAVLSLMTISSIATTNISIDSVRKFSSWTSITIVIFWWILVLVHTLVIINYSLGSGFFYLAYMLLGSTLALIIEESSRQDGWLAWIFSVFFAVVVPLSVFGRTANLLVQGIRYTVAEGDSTFLVLASLLAIGLTVLLPLLPYIFVLNSTAAYIPLIPRRRVRGPGVSFKQSFAHFPTMSMLFFLLVIAFRYPYSDREPLKVFFTQQIDLDTNNQTSQIIAATGLDGIFAGIPHLKEQTCNKLKAAPRLWSCSYPGLVPKFDKSPPIGILAGSSAKELIVHSEYSTLCRVEFEKAMNISIWTYFEEDETDPVEIYNVTVLNVLRRRFGGGFGMKLNTTQSLNGTVSCRFDDFENVREAGALVKEMPPWLAFTAYKGQTLVIKKSFQL